MNEQYPQSIGAHLGDIKKEMTDDKFAENILTKKIKNLKKMIRTLMENDEKCRNDDFYLIWQIWKKQGLIFMGKKTEYIGREDYFRAQNPASIIRIRASIQRQQKVGGAELLPTIKEVAIARGFAEEEWKIQVRREKGGLLV